MKTSARSAFRSLVLPLLAPALFAPALRAQDALITPTAITSSTSGTDFFPVARLIDGSGLSNPTPTLAALGTHAAAASANAWAAEANAPDYFAGAGALPAPVLICTLPGARVVSELVVWGYHSGAADGSEAREFQVAFSTDGVNFGDSVSVSSTPVLIDQARRLAFPGGGRLATRVRVTITDNHFGAAAGGERVGLGELRFAGRAPIVVNTAVDEFDTPSGVNVSLREALRDAAAVAGADAISFAAALSGQTVAVDSSLAVADVTVQTTSTGLFTDVAVNAGTLSFGAGSGWTGSGKIQLGATSGSAAATVELNGPAGFALAAPITIRAGSSGVKTLRVANGAGTNTFAGNIVLLADATVEKTAGIGLAVFAGDVNIGAQQLSVNASAQVNLNGRVFRGDGAGTARLVKNGSSALAFNGTGDNTRLVATLSAGQLSLGKTSNAAVHALGGGLPAGTAALTVASAGFVLLDGGDQIADLASVTVNGTLDLFATESIDALNGSGTVQADVASTLTVGAGNGSGSFTGTLNSLLSLTKTGPGAQTIGGGNMTGAVLVSGGTLEINGALNQSSGATVQSGATLAGGGTVATLALQSGSSLAPGAPGGIGTLNVAGGTTWNGGATARFHLSGSSNTSDKIASSGALSKGSAGSFAFDFQGTGTGDQTYTLATFASSNFTAADFTFTGLAPGVIGSFALSGTALTFTTQSFIVTTTADSGPGSLRQAVLTAASNPGADTITFSAALGGPIVLTSEIVIGSAVTLDASALPAGATISGGNTTRLFFVSIGQTVVLKKLTLTSGNGVGAVLSGFGGAVYSDGTLTLEDCTVAGNTATTAGGLFSGGSATLTRCTFSQNTSSGSAGGMLNLGGSATLVSCTFSGNTSGAVGGGIFNFGGGATMLLRHCTIAGNTSGTSGGGIRNNAILTLTDCIIAGNTGSTPDIDSLTSATLTDSGRSVIGINTSVTTAFPAGTPNANGDFAGTAASPVLALLAPLGNYGGLTQTMALQPGSPARDHAITSTATADQRGFPIVGVPDIGAYEAGTFANFAAWSQETAGTALAFGNDDEKDGATNGLEYATRRDPAASDTPLAPALAGPAGSHTFTFRYRAAARDLRYIVQRNADLNNAAAWTDIYRFNTSTGLIDELLSVTGDENPATEIITLTDPALGAQLFWRLHIEQVP